MRHVIEISKVLRTAGALGLSAALVFSGVPTTAYAASSAEIQAELQEVQAQLVVLNDEAEQCAYELQATEASLRETNAAIDDLTVAIAETQEELAVARDELTLTMSWSYKVRPDIVSLILSSESFEELVSNVYYANKVSGAQTAAIERVRDLRELQDQQMSDLEDKRTEQETLVAEQEVRAEAANAAVAELAAYQEGLSVELQEALAAEEAARQEEARRQAEAEAARVAAEAEAARQAEAERQAQQQSSSGDSGSSSSGSQESYDEPDDSGYDDSGSSDSGSSDSGSSGGYYEETYVPASGMVDRAYAVIGSNYTWSGYVWTGSIYTSYFTCSGLVDFALGRPTNSSWPESLYAEVGSNMVYDTSQLNYGDLVFFSYAGRYPGHVGIYIGGGYMIDSCPGGGVAIRSLDWMDFIGGGPLW